MRQVKKLLLLFTLILLHTLSNAQHKKVDLSQVNTVQQAGEFKLSYPEYEGNVFSIIPGEERFEKISPDIFFKKNGYILIWMIILTKL